MLWRQCTLQSVRVFSRRRVVNGARNEPGGRWAPTADGTDNEWAVEGAAKWWHFVAVAWVFIYPTLYLVG